MNAKGQIGNLLVTFFVLIFLFIIMTFFVFMATGVVLINKPAPPEASFESYEASRASAVEKVVVNLEGQNMSLLFVDTFALYDKGVINKENFQNILKYLARNENSCVIASKKISAESGNFRYGNDYFVQNVGGSVLINIESYDYAGPTIYDYREKGKLISLFYDEEAGVKKYLEFY